MYIKALGKNFPLCYTVEAQGKIAKKAGRLEELEKLFDEEDAARSTENTVFLLAVMMDGAVKREKVKCKALGEEYKGGEAPTYEELLVLLDPTELSGGVISEIMEAMGNGNKTTVEVKEEKNAETTP